VSKPNSGGGYDSARSRALVRGRHRPSSPARRGVRTHTAAPCHVVACDPILRHRLLRLGRCDFAAAHDVVQRVFQLAFQLRIPTPNHDCRHRLCGSRGFRMLGRRRRVDADRNHEKKRAFGRHDGDREGRTRKRYEAARDGFQSQRDRRL
jgi:hypothetical protein